MANDQVQSDSAQGKSGGESRTIASFLTPSEAGRLGEIRPWIDSQMTQGANVELDKKLGEMIGILDSVIERVLDSVQHEAEAREERQRERAMREAVEVELAHAEAMQNMAHKADYWKRMHDEVRTSLINSSAEFRREEY